LFDKVSNNSKKGLEKVSFVSFSFDFFDLSIPSKMSFASLTNSFYLDKQFLKQNTIQNAINCYLCNKIEIEKHK
jgi:hypothetical protein